MRRLIEPWTMTIQVGDDERVQTFPPLVDTLARIVSPSSGRTVGGANDPSARSVVNVQALDLLGHIQDVTRAWLQEWRVQVAGETKLDLRGFWDRLHTLHNAGDLDGTTYEHLAAFADTWVTRIWDLIEPPLTRPLRGVACPKCGEAKWVNENSDQADNLLITYRQGQEVTAECRWRECGAIWVGRRGLIDLGRSLGIPLDIEALAELDTPM